MIHVCVYVYVYVYIRVHALTCSICRDVVAVRGEEPRQIHNSVCFNGHSNVLLFVAGV